MPPLVIELQLFHHAARTVLNHDVGGLDHAQQNFAPRGRLRLSVITLRGAPFKCRAEHINGAGKNFLDRPAKRLAPDMPLIERSKTVSSGFAPCP